MAQSKIAIIGAGRVGSTIAYALILRNSAAEILLVDVNKEVCTGEVEDLSDVLSFSNTSSIGIGTPEQAAQADIIIITAGKAQVPGQSRIDLMQVNAGIIELILSSLQPINPNAIIIIVSNPVDILTRLVQEFGILPKAQIFGSGTMLDTQRLRGFIAKKVNVAEQSVHVYILGEHGDSQFVAWSDGDIGGVPLLQYPGLSKKDLDAIAEKTRNKAYDIIKCKGSTYYGVATCVAIYCENILFNQRRIMPVSCWVESIEATLSFPCVIGSKGVEQIIDIPLNHEEKLLLDRSVEGIKATYASLKKS
jgi:L-lactate dehydrogenase